MSDKEKEIDKGQLSRRQFLKSAGLVIGGSAVGSSILLSACSGGETTKTVTVTTSVSKYVCPSCNQEFNTVVALSSHIESAHPGAVQIEGLTTLKVNGTEYKLILEPHWTLAWVLREKLALTGTKISCDMGACGLCTVLMDNQPVLACMLLGVECGGKEIVTIEGLEVDGKLDPIQQAFIDNDAMQCGYCIPGAIMMAKSLLINNSSPSKDQVVKALSGVLCRCGTYQKQFKAVLEVV